MYSKTELQHLAPSLLLIMLSKNSMALDMQLQLHCLLLGLER